MDDVWGNNNFDKAADIINSTFKNVVKQNTKTIKKNSGLSGTCDSFESEMHIKTTTVLKHVKL